GGPPRRPRGLSPAPRPGSPPSHRPALRLLGPGAMAPDAPEDLHSSTLAHHGRHERMSGGQTSPRKDSGLGTEQELRRRLSLATPADTVRGLSFLTLMDAVRLDLGEEALAQFLSKSQEKSYKSFFNYPVSEYLVLLYHGAWMLSEKHGGFDEAIRRIAGG